MLLDSIDLNLLTVALSDELTRDCYLANYPEFFELMRQTLKIGVLADDRPNLGDCPAYGDLVAMQMTIFDNWKDRDPKDRKRGNRWGASVKAFTTAPVNWRRPAWAATSILWEAKDAVDKAKALQGSNRKYPISDHTVEDVRELAGVFPAGFIGVLAYKNPQDGTWFYNQHVVAIDLDDGGRIKDALMFSPACRLRFPAFVATDSNSDALTGKAMAISRHSELESMDHWSTGIGSEFA